MAATLKTTNFQIPYFAPSDYTSWASYNEAMEVIDLALETNKTNSQTNLLAIEALQKSVESNQTAIEKIEDEITEVNKTTGNLTDRIVHIEELNVQQENEIADIKTTLGGYTGDLTELENDVNTLKRATETNTTSINENAQAIAGLQTDVTNLTDMVGDISTPEVKDYTTHFAVEGGAIVETSGRRQKLPGNITLISLSGNYNFAQAINTLELAVEGIAPGTGIVGYATIQSKADNKSYFSSLVSGSGNSPLSGDRFIFSFDTPTNLTNEYSMQMLIFNAPGFN